MTDTNALFATADQLSTYSLRKIAATDPRVPDALAGASRAIRKYCGWHVFPEITETLKLDGPGGRELDLPSMHVTDVASVSQHGDVVDASTYDWSELGGIKLRRGWWTDRYRAIDVTLTHGWNEVEDIQRVLLAIVTRELSSPSGATREQAGQVSVSWAITSQGASGGLAVLSNEYAVLDAYRIVGS